MAVNFLQIIKQDIFFILKINRPFNKPILAQFFHAFKLNKKHQLCKMPLGTLFLIPVPLADEAAAKSFTPYLVDTINHIKEYIVENEKTARRCLKETGLKTPQSELLIHDYGKHKRGDSTADFFTGLKAGKDVGLMSEAG